MADQHWANRTLDAIYTEFLLRDFLGKVVPGTLLSIAFVFPWVGEKAFGDALKAVGDAGWGLWVVGTGVAWLGGMAVQGIGDLTTLLDPMPQGQSLDDYAKKRHAPPHDGPAGRRLERFAVVTEACGNGAIAATLGAISVLAASLTCFAWPYRWHLLVGLATLAVGLFSSFYRARRNRWAFLEQSNPEE